MPVETFRPYLISAFCCPLRHPIHSVANSLFIYDLRFIIMPLEDIQEKLLHNRKCLHITSVDNSQSTHHRDVPWRIQAFLSHYLLPVLLLHIPTLLQKVSKHGWWPFLRSLDYWEGHARRTVADDHVCEYPNQLLAGALDTFFDWLISLPLAVPARFRWSDTHQIDHDGHDTIILLVLETVINASRVREKKLEAGNN